MVLVGAGSTVPASVYARWVQEYGKRDPKIQLRYVPIGTSEGITQVSHGVSDFGAGEAALNVNEQRSGGLIELPTLLIAIVPIYNLPDVHGELRLSGDVLAEIFLGNVRIWNARQIARLNPNITLPDRVIHVVQRPGGKGSNYVFTDFLSQASATFRAQLGVSVSPKWPVGEPAERSSDMVDKVKSKAGAIGYVEYQYAVSGNISQASVLNSAGRFVRASRQTLTSACEAVQARRGPGFTSVINAPGADSFPITSFTWIYLRTKMQDSTHAIAVGDLLRWIYSAGQTIASEEGFTPLPPALSELAKKKAEQLYERGQGQ